MNDEQLKAALKEWVKDYCNNQFLIDNPDYDPDDESSDEFIESLPGGVNIFLDRAVAYFKKQSGKKSEALGDYSVSFETDIPQSIMKLIRVYRRVRFV